MMERMKNALVGLAASLCLVGLSHADASDPPMPEVDYEAARKAIDTTLGTARAACKPLKGQRQEVCLLRAKGEARVARARLEAERDPTPDRVQEASEAQAEADYAVARAGCRQGSDKARKACIAQAKDRRDFAVRQAKVEKVQALRAQQREGTAARPELTEKEKYAAAMARCNLSGPEREGCLAEAKRRFGKS